MDDRLGPPKVRGAGSAALLRLATQPLGLALDLGRLAAGELADTFLDRATGLARCTFDRPPGMPFGRFRFAFGLQTLVSGGLANVLALIRPRSISLGGWIADQDGPKPSRFADAEWRCLDGSTYGLLFSDASEASVGSRFQGTL
jgi:hypothetical protein